MIETSIEDVCVTCSGSVSCLDSLNRMSVVSAAGSSSDAGVVTGSGITVVARSSNLVLNSRILLVVVVDVEAKTSRVDAAVAPDEEGAKDRLGKDVENTIKDGLAVRSNDITAFRNSPSDGIKYPEESSQRTTVQERATNIVAKGSGMATALPDKDEDDVEKSSTA